LPGSAGMIITTNLEFSRWPEIFGNPVLTAALVDRMTHRSHSVDTNFECQIGQLTIASHIFVYPYLFHMLTRE
jgi:hypothetical protein